MGFCKLKHGWCAFSGTCERSDTSSQRARAEWCMKTNREGCGACASNPRGNPDAPKWGCGETGFECWREAYRKRRGK